VLIQSLLAINSSPPFQRNSCPFFAFPPLLYCEVLDFPSTLFALSLNKLRDPYTLFGSSQPFLIFSGDFRGSPPSVPKHPAANLNLEGHSKFRLIPGVFHLRVLCGISSWGTHFSARVNTTPVMHVFGRKPACMLRVLTLDFVFFFREVSCFAFEGARRTGLLCSLGFLFFPKIPRGQMMILAVIFLLLPPSLFPSDGFSFLATAAHRHC